MPLPSYVSITLWERVQYAGIYMPDRNSVTAPLGRASWICKSVENSGRNVKIGWILAIVEPLR